jgi:hypothetical protein
MNNSSTSAVTSKKSESKISHNDSNNQDDFITITEGIKLRNEQYKVLKIICDTYRLSLSQYIQQILIEAMKYDIDEDTLHDIKIYTKDFQDLATLTKRHNETWADAFHKVIMKSNISLVADSERAHALHIENISLNQQLEKANKKINELEQSYRELRDKVS